MGAAILDDRLGARVRMRCWGAFALQAIEGEADLRSRGRKARALLAYLAMHPGVPVNRERLMGLLWGERAEEQARASLRQALQELKPLANGIGLITVGSDSVTLEPAPLETDIELLHAAAARKAWHEMIALLPEPHERLFGDLDGLDSGLDDWLAIERARQSDALASLLAEAAAEAQREGAMREARLLATRLRERDPQAPPPPPPGASATPAAHPVAGPPKADPKPSPSPRPRRVAALASVALLALGAVAVGTLTLGSPAAPAAPSALDTSGEVNGLYLRARAKMKERNPKASEEARAMLERALALDEDFAPVIASLAQLAMPELFAAHLALQRGNLPSATRLAELNRSPRDDSARIFVADVVSKLVTLGRAGEAAALYDGPDGLLGFSARGPMPASPGQLTA